ncbi:MAG: M20/M25/M40 family metallo-hydrolase [Propionibacteriaceae bacterium]
MDAEEVMRAVTQRVRQLLDRQSLIAELAELISLESPSHDLAASATIASRLAEQWAPYGEVRLEPGPAGTHVLIEIAPVESEAAPVLLLGHSDTVWPLGTLEGPVPLTVDDQVVHGPGAYDMKAGLVVMAAAVRRLTALRLPHPAIRVLIAADEEVGSTAATPLVGQACAGVAAVFGFESPHPDGALKVGRLGSARVRLRVTGREAHAALDPDNGISAIDELLDQLLHLRARLAETQKRRPGEVLVNVGAISGGGRTNVIPGVAEALIGFRFATAAAEAEVMAELTGLKAIRDGAELELIVLSWRPPWQVGERDQALLALVSDLASPAGVTVAGRPATGAADTNTTGAMGVPTLDGWGPRGGGAHAVSEHVDVDSLVERVVLLTTVLTGLA